MITAGGSADRVRGAAAVYRQMAVTSSLANRLPKRDAAHRPAGRRRGRFAEGVSEAAARAADPQHALVLRTSTSN